MINVSLLLYWLLQMGVAFLSTITFALWRILWTFLSLCVYALLLILICVIL